MPAVNAAASAAAGRLSRRGSSRPAGAVTAYRGNADTMSSASSGGSSGSAAARRYTVSRGSCSPASGSAASSSLASESLFLDRFPS